MKKTASIALTLIFAVSLGSGAFAGGRGHTGLGVGHTPGQHHGGQMQHTTGTVATQTPGQGHNNGHIPGGQGKNHTGFGHDHNQGQTHTPGQYHLGN